MGPAVPPNAAALVGITLESRYQIADYRGQGNFTFCFEANDLTSGETVAVKILKFWMATAENILELTTERELLRRLAPASHIIGSRPGDQDVISISVAGGGPAVIPMTLHYVALELADGTLADLIADRDRLPWLDRLELFRDIAKGLHQMHVKHIFHRDAKSENVLVLVRGPNATARVADLGKSADLLAGRRFASEAYQIPRGDVRFAPPELLWGLGEEDEWCWRRVDHYLLGSILFELGTGQPLTSLLSVDPIQVLNSVVSASVDSRRRMFSGEIARLEGEYLRLWRLFEQELPPVLRVEGVKLLRMLTDPRPERRGLFRLGHPQRDDGWILRRVDIMKLLLTNALRDTRKLAAKKLRRSR